MFNVQRVVGKRLIKGANHADAEVGIRFVRFQQLCLTLLSQVSIPPPTSESSVSRLLNPNPVNHFHSPHTFSSQ